jgi:hypothetical protein
LFPDADVFVPDAVGGQLPLLIQRQTVERLAPRSTAASVTLRTVRSVVGRISSGFGAYAPIPITL